MVKDQPKERERGEGEGEGEERGRERDGKGGGETERDMHNYNKQNIMITGGREITSIKSVILSPILQSSYQYF